MISLLLGQHDESAVLADSGQLIIERKFVAVGKVPGCIFLVVCRLGTDGADPLELAARRWHSHKAPSLRNCDTEEENRHEEHSVLEAQRSKWASGLRTASRTRWKRSSKFEPQAWLLRLAGPPGR